MLRGATGDWGKTTHREIHESLDGGKVVCVKDEVPSAIDAREHVKPSIKKATPENGQALLKLEKAAAGL